MFDAGSIKTEEIAHGVNALGEEIVEKIALHASRLPIDPSIQIDFCFGLAYPPLGNVAHGRDALSACGMESASQRLAEISKASRISVVDENKDVGHRSGGVDGIELRRGFFDVPGDPVKCRVGSKAAGELTGWGLSDLFVEPIVSR